jgi:hypothetical protein
MKTEGSAMIAIQADTGMDRSNSARAITPNTAEHESRQLETWKAQRRHRSCRQSAEDIGYQVSAAIEVCALIEMSRSLGQCGNRFWCSDKYHRLRNTAAL